MRRPSARESSTSPTRRRRRRSADQDRSYVGTVATIETHQAIETVFRIERARLIAGLARMVRDVGLAEELAQDACVIALSEWPKSGVPDNPGAWLMAAAKRRAIDASRRNRMLARKHEQIG